MRKQPGLEHLERAEKIEKIRVRCPACSKLYEVKTADIHEPSPEFQCVGCHARFAFDYPSPEGSKALARLINAESHERDCPKCGALNPAGAHECYNCQVLFSKLEDLPLNPELKAQPSLVRKWKLLQENDKSLADHESFVMSCFELDALRFAIFKYEEIKDDPKKAPMAEMMLRRLRIMAEVAIENRRTQEEAAAGFAWRRWLMWLPYLISLALIVWGASGLAHRNMVGLGVSIACLVTGLILIVRLPSRL